MSQSYFQKFVPKKKNSVVKEEIRQAKKKAKKERSAAIEKRFEEKRLMKAAAREAAINQRKAAEAKAKEVPTEKTAKKTVESKTDRVISAANKQIKLIPKDEKQAAFGEMPLNKYLAHCGVCSRRDAVVLIKEGKVKVNGTVVIEPAFKVTEKD